MKWNATKLCFSWEMACRWRVSLTSIFANLIDGFLIEFLSIGHAILSDTHGKSMSWAHLRRKSTKKLVCPSHIGYLNYRSSRTGDKSTNYFISSITYMPFSIPLAFIAKTCTSGFEWTWNSLQLTEACWWQIAVASVIEFSTLENERCHHRKSSTKKISSDVIRIDDNTSNTATQSTAETWYKWMDYPIRFTWHDKELYINLCVFHYIQRGFTLLVDKCTTAFVYFDRSMFQSL